MCWRVIGYENQLSETILYGTQKWYRTMQSHEQKY